MAEGEAEIAGKRRGWQWLSWRRLLALVLVAVVSTGGVAWVVVPYVQELFKREG